MQGQIFSDSCELVLGVNELVLGVNESVCWEDCMRRKQNESISLCVSNSLLCALGCADS